VVERLLNLVMLHLVLVPQNWSPL